MAPRRIAGIARGSNAGSAYTVGNIRKETFPSCAMNNIASDVAAAIQKGQGQFAPAAPSDPNAH
jgi:hypothetical protein